MHPNYNFENEISNQYGIAAMNFRAIAKMLLTTYKVINQKEYDVIMWQACNLPSGSQLRIELLKTLEKMILKCRVYKIGQIQFKINL